MIALAATFAHFVAIDGHVLDPAAAFASFGIMGPVSHVRKFRIAAFGQLLKRFPFKIVAPYHCIVTRIS